jgi:hypothetical protein
VRPCDSGGGGGGGGVVVVVGGGGGGGGGGFIQVMNVVHDLDSWRWVWV